MEQAFSRTELLLGPAAMERLAAARVAVFGLGGVGGFVGGVTVCSVQLFLSLILRVFALPVGIGLAGGLGGMLLLVKGYGLYFPYSLLCLGMRANNTKLVLPVGQFLVTCLLCILVFSFLSIQWIKKRDVTTG